MSGKQYSWSCFYKRSAYLHHLPSSFYFSWLGCWIVENNFPSTCRSRIDLGQMLVKPRAKGEFIFSLQSFKLFLHHCPRVITRVNNQQLDTRLILSVKLYSNETVAPLDDITDQWPLVTTISPQFCPTFVKTNPSCHHCELLWVYPN